MITPSVRIEIIFSYKYLLEEYTLSFSRIRLPLCVQRSFDSSKLSDFQRIDERDFRVLIEHYFIQGRLPHETKEMLDKHYGQSALPIRTVYKWFQ